MTARPPVTLVVGRRELLARWAGAADAATTTATTTTTTTTITTAEHALDVEWWSDRPPPRGPVREVVGGDALRNLVIATKAPATLPEADRLRRYLDGRSAVAFSQNGVCRLWPPHGPAYVAARYPSASASPAAAAPAFLACVTSHALYSLGPFRSVHAATGDLYVGPVLPAAAAYLTRQLAEAPALGARAVSAADLWLLQLDKLALNACVNPLTALLRCPNGGLFAGPDDGPVARVMDRLVAQASRVLQALVARDAATLAPEHRGRPPLADRFAAPRRRRQRQLHAPGRPGRPPHRGARPQRLARRRRRRPRPSPRRLGPPRHGRPGRGRRRTDPRRARPTSALLKRGGERRPRSGHLPSSPWAPTSREGNRDAWLTTRSAVRGEAFYEASCHVLSRLRQDFGRRGRPCNAICNKVPLGSAPRKKRNARQGPLVAERQSSESR